MSDNRSRTLRVVFRVSEQENRLMEEKMKLAGIQNREAYLRKMAIDGHVIRLDLKDVRELVSLLRNATNNLNQIARRANETRSIYEADIEDLQSHYDKLWDTASGVLKALAKI